MARLKLCVNWFDVVLSAGLWKTVAAIRAPSDQMVAIDSVWQSCNGVAGDAEHNDVRLTRITPSSGTGDSTTPQKTNNAMTCTPRSICRTNFSVEPTESGTAPYLFPHKSHPQGSSSKESTFDDVVINEETEIAVQIKVPSGGATGLKSTGHVLIEE